jgi:hypothetical protein
MDDPWLIMVDDPVIKTRPNFAVLFGGMGSPPSLSQASCTAARPGLVDPRHRVAMHTASSVQPSNKK